MGPLRPLGTGFRRDPVRPAGARGWRPEGSGPVSFSRGRAAAWCFIDASSTFKCLVVENDPATSGTASQETPPQGWESVIPSQPGKSGEDAGRRQKCLSQVGSARTGRYARQGALPRRDRQERPPHEGGGAAVRGKWDSGLTIFGAATTIESTLRKEVIQQQ
jgi:hypothetical protein